MIVIISIHPPRAGRDAWSAADSARTTNFNPPSPCGEGRMERRGQCTDYKFQSTLPVRGGTKSPQYGVASQLFQSTLPVRGGTASALRHRSALRYFNPPSPCGEGRPRIGEGDCR